MIEGFRAGFHPHERWRPSVIDYIDSEFPFGWLFHLRDISEWLA
jgi:hypothetical protein